MGCFPYYERRETARKNELQKFQRTHMKTATMIILRRNPELIVVTKKWSCEERCSVLTSRVLRY